MSTRSLLTVIGGVIGAAYGYPQLGFTLGALVGSAVDPQIIQGPKIGEVSAQTSAEGAPRAIVHGTAPCIGNVIQTGPLIKVTVSEEQGKGGPEVETEHGYRTWAIRACEGPIGGYLRIWEDNKLVYDVTPGSQMLAESAKWAENVVFYLGDESQLPDPNLVALNADTPAYRGSAYVVFVMKDVTARAGSIPQYRFEVTRQLTTIDLTPINCASDGAIGSSNGYISGPVPPGSGGGASWTEGQIEAAPIRYPGAAGTLMNGNAYLAVWRFQSRGVMNVEAWLNFNGLKIYSQEVTLGDGEYIELRLQLNMEPNGVTPVEIGFTAIDASQGYFIVGVYRLNTSATYFPLSDTDPPPLTYAPDHPYFGVVQDGSGDLFSAGVLHWGFDDDTIWGPDTFVIKEGAPTDLAAIIADCHDRVGFPASKRDVSALSGISVSGTSFAGDYTASDCINTLRPGYFFYKTQYDGKLHYQLLGDEVIETVTIDDLVEMPDTTRREQALEVPKKLHLYYAHAGSGYARVKATAPRTNTPDLLTTGEASIEIPAVLNEDQAAQTVDKMYKVTRTEVNGQSKLVVPMRKIKYVPGRCIGVSLRGQVRRQRIEQMDINDGQIELTLKDDRQSAYTSALTGVPIPPPTLPPSTIVGDTVQVILDMASRVDSEDDLNYLVAVSGARPAWYGARYQRSFDGGANYSTVEDISTASIIGTLLEDVAAASPYFTDGTNRVKVMLYRDSQTLESIADAQFLSEGNPFALVRPDGSVEVMQFRDAVEEVDGSFTLSTLHRGLLNSGGTAHTAGALFVMLQRPTHIPASAGWIGQAITHRSISFGESAENTTNDQTLTFVGRSQIEWPVAYLRLARNGSNVISGTWTPRHRFGSPNFPVASINFQGYRVMVDDGTTSVTFDRATPDFTYDASSMASPVTVTVSALNRITGPGPSTSGTV